MKKEEVRMIENSGVNDLMLVVMWVTNLLLDVNKIMLGVTLILLKVIKIGGDCLMCLV